MSSLQQRFAAVTDTITNLIAQLRELADSASGSGKLEYLPGNRCRRSGGERVLAEIGHSQFENAE